MKFCPFKTAAVQAEFARITNLGWPFEEALQMAQDRFGCCDANCPLWIDTGSAYGCSFQVAATNN